MNTYLPVCNHAFAWATIHVGNHAFPQVTTHFHGNHVFPWVTTLVHKMFHGKLRLWGQPRSHTFTYNGSPWITSVSKGNHVSASMGNHELPGFFGELHHHREPHLFGNHGFPCFHEKPDITWQLDHPAAIVLVHVVVVIVFVDRPPTARMA